VEELVCGYIGIEMSLAFAAVEDYSCIRGFFVLEGVEGENICYFVRK
jgi:hypothetical protein